MKPQNTASKEGRPPKPPRKRFTPCEANRALVYVRKIVQDIVDSYAEFMRLRDVLEESDRSHTFQDRFERVRRRAQHLADRLNQLKDELHEVGCELKDWSQGLVDFPSSRSGADVALCWKLGEPEVAYWHDADDGFRGRKSIDSAF